MRPSRRSRPRPCTSAPAPPETAAALRHGAHARCDVHARRATSRRTRALPAARSSPARQLPARCPLLLLNALLALHRLDAQNGVRRPRPTIDGACCRCAACARTVRGLAIHGNPWPWLSWPVACSLAAASLLNAPDTTLRRKNSSPAGFAGASAPSRADAATVVHDRWAHRPLLGAGLAASASVVHDADLWIFRPRGGGGARGPSDPCQRQPLGRRGRGRGRRSDRAAPRRLAARLAAAERAHWRTVAQDAGAGRQGGAAPCGPSRGICRAGR